VRRYTFLPLAHIRSYEDDADAYEPRPRPPPPQQQQQQRRRERDSGGSGGRGGGDSSAMAIASSGANVGASMIRGVGKLTGKALAGAVHTLQPRQARRWHTCHSVTHACSCVVGGGDTPHTLCCSVSLSSMAHAGVTAQSAAHSRLRRGVRAGACVRACLSPYRWSALPPCVHVMHAPPLPPLVVAAAAGPSQRCNSRCAT
jgi:hypothetical protein